MRALDQMSAQRAVFQVGHMQNNVINEGGESSQELYRSRSG